MEIELFGHKMRIEILLLCLLIGYILGAHLLCSCSKISVKEGFAMLQGADVSYRMGADIPSSWENHPEVKENGAKDWLNSLESYTAPDTTKSLDNGELFLLNDNKFDPKCCPSFYSNSMGCACLSPEQAVFVSQRGNNSTYPTEY